MKNFKLYLILLLLCFSIMAYGESISFVPTMKIKACVINVNNISGSLSDGEKIFEYLENNKYLMTGNTSYDMNFSFYNPRGDQDSVDYWKLDINDISYAVLNQYDVVVLPLNNSFSNLPNIKQKAIANWVCEGGILWLDNYGIDITNPLFLPLSSYSIKGDVTSSSINSSSPIRSYPFKTTLATWANGKGGLSFDDGDEFSFSNNQVFKSNYLINGIAKVGSGKVIHTGRAYTEDKSHIYDCMNLLFQAFEPSSNNSYAKVPSILGQNLNVANSVHGSMPLVVDGNVFYVDGSKLYVNGVNLTSDVNGQVPDENISAPCSAGDSDIYVYDSKGTLYLCSGLKYDNNGDIDKSDVTWLKLYTSSHDCLNTIKYAPIVYGYWVYFVSDSSMLHIVYTKELKDGEAKYYWTTNGGSATTSVNVAGPVLSSRKDVFGSYIVEVSWITNNDPTNTVYYLNSIPVMITGEISKKQPQNETEQRIIKLNYSGFPSIKGVESFQVGWAGDTNTLPDKVFCKVSCGDIVFQAYDKNNTSKYDYKINTGATGSKQNGVIQFNTKKVNNEYKFADTSNHKDEYTNKYNYKVTYVPKYTNAMRSELKGAYDIKLYDQLQYTNNGFIYHERKDPSVGYNTDKLNYILKYAYTEDTTSGTHTKYPNWAFLPHTGFSYLSSPFNVNSDATSLSGKLSIYQNIDWGFLAGDRNNSISLDGINNTKIYVNGIKTIKNKVYISLTATYNYINKSAIVCLDSTKKPEIRIVDKDRNNVNLKYYQTRSDGNRVVNYKVRLYQPAPYETEFATSELTFDVNPSDYERGIITVDNLQKFIKSKKSLFVTSSLPAFIQLEATTNSDPQATQKVSSYLPIYPGTCQTLDWRSYNNELGEVSMPIWNGSDNNENKVLYADLSDWNIIDWYAVLPDNNEVFGDPIISGEKVTLVGYERDRSGRIKQNKLYNIDPKGNVLDGYKVKKDCIKVSELSNSISFNDSIKVSMGCDTVALGTDNTVYTLKNKKSLVIDNTSLLELDASGDVAWKLSKVEYTDGGSNNYNFTLENPVRARYVFDNNHIVVADAGTKTIFIIDKNGKLKSSSINNDTGMYWMFNSFVDSYGLLRAGADTSLGYVSDFVFFTESNNTKTLNHFLVADSTNKRVLDLVVETDLNGNIINNQFYNGNVLPYLNWVTYDIIPDNKYNYVSLDITEKVKDCNGDEMRAVVCGVANYNAASRSSMKKTKGGSVLIYDYRMNIDNSNLVSQENHYKRFGRIYDTIGKKGDTIYDLDTSDTKNGYLNGLRKVVIENLDGRNFDEDNIKNYDQLKLLICDDFGVNEYYIDQTQNVANLIYYYWKNNLSKSVNTKLFGLDNPNYDSNIFPLTSSAQALMKGRFKLWYDETNDYTVNNNITQYAPIKAPLIPVDVKVLSNGNWLILNGYSGKVDFTYKMPGYSDGANLLEISGDYYGEAIEVEFDSILGYDYPIIVWTSNQFESYTGSNITSDYDDVTDFQYFINSSDGQARWSSNNANLADNLKNTVVGGWKYNNKTLKAPKSIDR